MFIQIDTHGLTTTEIMEEIHANLPDEDVYPVGVLLETLHTLVHTHDVESSYISEICIKPHADMVSKGAEHMLAHYSSAIPLRTFEVSFIGDEIQDTFSFTALKLLDETYNGKQYYTSLVETFGRPAIYSEGGVVDDPTVCEYGVFHKHRQLSRAATARLIENTSKGIRDTLISRIRTIQDRLSRAAEGMFGKEESE